jgi:hypothetical protein
MKRLQSIAEAPEFIRKGFPRTWYYPEHRLLVWFPRGVLNAAFADQVLEFAQMEERIQDTPFDRYTDLSGLTEIRLELDHLFKIASRRKRVAEPVKSAFFASHSISFVVALMYERLMTKAPIQVRAFDQRKQAAEWLDVPLKVLQAPD